MDGVQLKSLRVTAEMDVSAYTRAMQEKVAADARGAASSSAVGTALARQDAAIEKAGAKMVAISRQFVDGYGSAARFEKSIRDIGRAFDSGQFGAGDEALKRVSLTIDQLYRKSGLLADATTLARQGFVSIAPVVENLNNHYAAQARSIDALAAAQQKMAQQAREATQAQRAQAEINQRLGVGQSAAAGGATFSAMQAQADRLAIGRQKEMLAEAQRLGEANQQRIATLQRQIPTQERLNKEIAEYDRWLKAGAISTELHASATDLARKKYSDFQMQMQGVAGTGRRVSNEMTILSFQLNDVVTGLMLGQSPFMIMAQQGGQVLQILQTGQGGVSGTLKNIGATLAGLVTPATVAVGSLAVVGLTALVASERWANAQREIRRSLAGLGRDAGVTAEQINQIADATAKMQGISTSNARSGVAALVGTGRIDPAYLQRIAAIQKDLAATLAIDLQEASAVLAGAFADPLRGMEQLNDRLGGLTQSTRSYIRTQIASGNEGAAYTAMLNTFTPRLGRASELTSVWARAWDQVKISSSAAMDSVGRAIDRATQTPSQSFGAQAQARLEALEAANRGQVVDRTSGRVLGGRSAFGITQDELQAELDGRKRVSAELELQRLAVNAIRTGQEAINAATEAQARTQFDVARARRQVETGAATAVQMGLPERLQIEGVRRLADSYRELYTAKESALQNQGRENGNEIYRRAADDMRSAQRALRETVTDSSGMFARDGQLLLDNNAILERRRSLIQQNADRVQVERQGLTAVTQAEQAAAAAARVRQQAREQGAAAGGQELVNAQATAAAETTRLAINHQMSQAARERILSAQLQVESIRAETAAMGGSVGAIERARLEQQLLADAKREYGRLGLSVPPAEIAAYRQLAAVMGEARQAQAELRAQRDIAFERQVIGLPDGEAQIARNLRQIYGDDGWRQQMDGTLAQQARFNEQLKLTNDLGKSFGNDFLSGLRESKTLFDALTSAATRLSNRLADMGMERFMQALMNGQNPFQAAFGGYSGSASGSFGNSGLLGLSPSRLGGILQSSVSDGAADGIKSALKGGDGGSGAFGGSFGTQLGGGLLLGSSVLGAYGAGKQGGVGGIVSGTIGGAVAGATALPAILGVTGPVGALIGGAASLLSGLASRIGGSPERDKAREQWNQQAPTREVYLASLRGDVQGGLAQSFAEQQQKVGELSQQASFGRQNESVWKQMELDMWKFKIDTSLKFIEPLDNMLEALESGLGTNSPIAQAHQTVQTLREEMLKFIDDTETAAKTVGHDAVEFSRRAQGAAQAYALTLLRGAEEQTAVRREFDRLNQTAISLQKVLVDLGMGSEQAAAAISENLVFAVAQLKNETEDGLLRRSNSAMGNGYLNDIADQMEQWAKDLADAQLLGIQKGFVDNTNLAEIQKIITGAGLSGAAFDDLIKKFPELEGAVRRAASSLEDILDRQRGYLDRYFNATNDDSTLEGQLRAFERNAAREREEEIRAGGEAMAELELAISAERLRVLRDFQSQQTRVLEQAQEAYLSFVRRIKEYTDGLRAGEQSPLSPQARLSAAQSQYDAQLALAAGGNRDALNGITSYASDLLGAARDYHASSSAYQAIWAATIGQLEALPTQVSAEQFIVNAITSASTANVNAIDLMRSTLTTAVNSGSATAIAGSLSSFFTTLDTSVNGVLDFSEFNAGLNAQGLAKNVNLQSIFNELDVNGDAQLQKDELIRLATVGVQSNTGTTAGNTGTTAANTNNTTNAVGVGNVVAQQIASLQSTSAQQLQILNSNFSPQQGNLAFGPFTLNGVPNSFALSSGGALDFLRKIAFNTYAISQNTFGVRQTGTNIIGVFGSGGLVGGNLHSAGGTMINAERGEYVLQRSAASALAPWLDDLNRGRLPVVPVPMAGNDNGSMAVVRELRELRKEVAQLRAQVAQHTAIDAEGHSRTASAAEDTSRRVAQSTTDMRQAANRPRTAGRY